jgi:PPK2 family polyphosphate:nucleotide phosphotransferase
MRPAHTITAPGPVSLASYDPADTAGISQEQAAAQLPAFQRRLSDLQELLYGAGTQSVLVILQGMDTSGKDGTIKHVMSQVNPIGCEVTSFKVPTDVELRHDFLWRIHQRTPARGMLAIFNRSQYEDVVTARVRKVITAQECRQRYLDINAFELALHHGDTLLLKFFLHISKDEQRKRLLAREEDRDKSWKLSLADWQDRAYWDDYQEAYEKALGRCSASWAPWHIIPANHKWYRNYLVAKILIERLAEHESHWKAALHQRGEVQRQALLAAHLPERERSGSQA